MKDCRKRLISAALQLFARQGLQTPPIPAICRKAGVATGSFYNHFNSRNELILAVNAVVEQQLFYHLEETDAETGGISERIRLLISRLLEFYLQDRDRFFFHYHFHNSLLGTEYRKKRGLNPKDLGSVMTSHIRQGIDEGIIVDLPIDIHFKYCVEVLISLVRDHYLEVQPLDPGHLAQIPQMCLKSILKETH